MWEAVRHLAGAKPVIASIGNVAASGGYYVASAADEILAHPNSLVGSIGVVGGKLNLAGLTEDAGIHTFVLKRGERAAWSTPVRGLTVSERDAFEELLRSTYDRFIDRVAAGREMEREAVLAAAEGRVMTATDGDPLGLVDEMAGLGEALQRARAAGGLAPDSAVEVWPATKGVIETINELLGGGEDNARKIERAVIGAVSAVGGSAARVLAQHDAHARSRTRRAYAPVPLVVRLVGCRHDGRAVGPTVLAGQASGEVGHLILRTGDSQAAVAEVNRPAERGRLLVEPARGRPRWRERRARSTRSLRTLSSSLSAPRYELGITPAAAALSDTPSVVSLAGITALVVTR